SVRVQPLAGSLASGAARCAGSAYTTSPSRVTNTVPEKVDAEYATCGSHCPAFATNGTARRSSCPATSAGVGGADVRSEQDAANGRTARVLASNRNDEVRIMPPIWSSAAVRRPMVLLPVPALQ